MVVDGGSIEGVGAGEEVEAEMVGVDEAVVYAWVSGSGGTVGGEDKAAVG